MTDVQPVPRLTLSGTIRKGILYAQIAGQYYLRQYSPMMGPTVILIGQALLLTHLQRIDPHSPCLIPYMFGIFISMKYWLHSLWTVLGSTMQTIEKSKEFCAKSQLLILPEEISSQLASI